MKKDKRKGIKREFYMILSEAGLKGLSLKQKVIVFYFTLSFFMLSMTDETPIYMMILVLLNFANAVRLTKKLPLPR